MGRFVTMGIDALARILVVVYTYRSENIRIIFGSTRRTTRKGAVHGRIMKTYDFSKGKRGPIVKVPEGKEKITIRIDGDIVDWFRHQVDLVQGGSYQTLMNQALREYVDGKSPTLEGTLRRVIREELRSRTA
jgi:uncharacterized protein (DUF4415 family)